MTDAGPAEQAIRTPYYVVFDVEVRDALQYMEYMTQVLHQIEAAGGNYLARGGPHTVYEGDWLPYRLVLMEFPSREAFEGFYYSPAYQDLHAMRDEVSYASFKLLGLTYRSLAHNQGTWYNLITKGLWRARVT